MLFFARDAYLHNRAKLKFFHWRKAVRRVGIISMTVVPIVTRSESTK